MTDRGNLAAKLLQGVWRSEVTRSDIPIDDALLRSLRESGSLGLVAPRLHGRLDPAAVEAREAQTWQAIQASIRTRAVVNIVTAMRSVGIDPILFKGLAAARYYSVQGSRPIGDIDLVVSPSDLASATNVLNELGYHRVWDIHPVWWTMLEGPDAVIDLQTGLYPLDDREARLALESNCRFPVAGTHLRVLPPEIEIRFNAVHAVRHMLQRPVWLCDLCAVIEAVENLDWDVILAGSWRTRSWIEGAIGVACRLLDLNVPSPVLSRCSRAAAWVDPYVVNRWGNGEQQVITERLLAETLAKRRTIRGAFRTVVDSWPDPLHAVAHRGWPLSRTVAHAALVTSTVERAATIGMRLFWPGREVMGVHDPKEE